MWYYDVFSVSVMHSYTQKSVHSIPEDVDTDDNGDAELAGVLDVTLQVGATLLHKLEVL